MSHGGTARTHTASARSMCGCGPATLTGHAALHESMDRGAIARITPCLLQGCATRPDVARGGRRHPHLQLLRARGHIQRACTGAF